MHLGIVAGFRRQIGRVVAAAVDIVDGIGGSAIHAIIFSIGGCIGGGVGGLVYVDVDVATGRAGILVAAVDLILADNEGGLAAVGPVAVILTDVDGGSAAHAGATAAAIEEGQLAAEGIDSGVAVDIAGEGVVGVISSSISRLADRSLPTAFTAAVDGRADIAAVDVDLGVAEHLAVLAATVDGVLEVAAIDVNLAVVAGGEGGVVRAVGARDTTAAAADIAAEGFLSSMASYRSAARAADGIAVQGKTDVDDTGGGVAGAALDGAHRSHGATALHIAVDAGAEDVDGGVAGDGTCRLAVGAVAVFVLATAGTPDVASMGPVTHVGGNAI